MSQLTVVVTSVNGGWALFPTLQALYEQQVAGALEVLVVDRLGGELASQAQAKFPAATWIEVPRSTTIPQMRHIAFERAASPHVAVIEDHVLVPKDWGTQLLAAVGPNAPVVAGAVENAATEKLVDWAAFLCEYSHCAPPLQGGVVQWLTGNNVVYTKTILDRYSTITAAGVWENQLHDAIKRDGAPLTCVPEIVVNHKMHYTFFEYLSQRFLYARSYAGARVRSSSSGKRLAFGAAAFALPPLLFWRTIKRVMAKKRYNSQLAKSLPLIGVFVVAWGLGEVVGYWFGAGDSLSKVR